MLPTHLHVSQNNCSVSAISFVFVCVAVRPKFVFTL